MTTNNWQQPTAGESQKAFSAFCAYRDLEPTNRSIDMAYFTHHAQGKTTANNRASSHWVKWSSQHDWSNRVAGYDREQTEKVREQFEAERLADCNARLAIWRGYRAKLLERLKTVDVADITIGEMRQGLQLANEGLRKEYGEVDNKQEMYINRGLSDILAVVEDILPKEQYMQVLEALSDK